MKVYILSVSDNDFDYDEITYAVVLAENKEQAIEIAMQKRNVSWLVDRVMELDKPGLVKAYIRHG